MKKPPVGDIGRWDRILRDPRTQQFSEAGTAGQVARSDFTASR
jgi:hypothetical protein